MLLVMTLSMQKELSIFVFYVPLLWTYLRLEVKRLNLIVFTNYYIRFNFLRTWGGIDRALKALSVSPGLHVNVRLKFVIICVLEDFRFRLPRVVIMVNIKSQPIAWRVRRMRIYVSLFKNIVFLLFLVTCWFQGKLFLTAQCLRGNFENFIIRVFPQAKLSLSFSH